MVPHALSARISPHLLDASRYHNRGGKEEVKDWYHNQGGREKALDKYWNGGGREKALALDKYWNEGGREKALEYYINIVVPKREARITCHHLLSPAITCCHLPSPVVTCRHLLSPAVTCHHLLSPAITCHRGEDQGHQRLHGPRARCTPEPISQGH